MKRLIFVALICVFSLTEFSVGEDKSLVADSCDQHLHTSIPKFRVVRTEVNRSLSSASLILSIAPKDAEKQKIVALVCKLGRDYSEDQVLVVWILDDYRAAKQFRVSDTSISIRRDVRASYSFDRKENSQALTWMPDRNNPFNAIQIDLGPPPPLPTEHQTTAR